MRTVSLFAKPVVAGEVKTRLSPPLRPEQCARLYGAFLADIALMLASEPSWEWVVHSTDAERQRATWPDVAPPPMGWRAQEGEDLGRRIEAALDDLLGEGRRPVVLLGSDHPTVEARLVEGAFTALENADLVLGPTLDGGYYLIGSNRPHPGLLRGIPWSSGEVLPRTLDRIEETGLKLALVRPWYDVDRVDDLEFLRTHLRALDLAGRPVAAHTAEVLRTLERVR